MSLRPYGKVTMSVRSTEFCPWNHNPVTRNNRHYFSSCQQNNQLFYKVHSTVNFSIYSFEPSRRMETGLFGLHDLRLSNLVKSFDVSFLISYIYTYFVCLILYYLPKNLHNSPNSLFKSLGSFYMSWITQKTPQLNF